MGNRVLLLSVMLVAAALHHPTAFAAAADEVPAQRAIMTGDRLRVTVAEAPDMNRVYVVAGDGTMDLPLVGRLAVEGLHTREVADVIKTALEKSYFKRATVAVEVSEFVEGALMVLGAVKSPGVVPFRGDEMMTLMEVIVRSGGLAEGAAGNQVRILRWTRSGRMERQIITVDVQHMLDNLDFTKDQFLRPRDIIYVPSVGGGGKEVERNEFLALGEVGRPGFHSHEPGMNLIRAVVKAGAMGRSAKLDAARILRPDASGAYRVIPVDLARLFGAADMSMNIPVLPGDILFVPSAEQAAGGKVYLLGQVGKPGIVGLQFNRDTTLARTLLTYGGLGQFANTKEVKILRFAPDGSKQTLTVDVGRILKTGAFEDDVPLKNEDVIIVPELIFGLGL